MSVTDTLNRGRTAESMKGVNFWVVLLCWVVTQSRGLVTGQGDNQDEGGLLADEQGSASD